MTSENAAFGQRLASIAEKTAWLCVLAVAVIVPAVNANPSILGISDMPLTVDQIELPKMVALVVLSWLGLAAWGIAQWLRPTGVRIGRYWWWLAGFLALASLSAVMSPYPQLAYVGRWFHHEGLAQLATYVVLCFLAAQTATKTHMTWLVRLGVVTGLVLALYGIAQALGLDAANWLGLSWPGGRAFATWNNPDFFGGYLLFPLAFSAAVANDADRWWRLLGLVALPLISISLVMTLTRGAWLAALFAGIVLLVGLGRRGFPWKRTLVVAAAVLVVALAASYVATDGRIVSRALSSFAPGDDGVGGRIDLWQNTLPHALDNPLVGTGPDTFATNMLRIMAMRPIAVPDDPHNVVLYLMMTLGIPATVALAVFIGSVLVRSAKIAFAEKGDGSTVPVLALWTGVVAYGAHLMLSVTIVAGVAIFFVCLGVLAAASLPRRSMPRSVAIAASVAAALLFVGAAYLGGRALAADHAYFLARSVPRDSGERLQLAERANRLNPLNERYALEVRNAKARR